MTDLQLLFAVLVGLYGSECLCWLRGGSVAFQTWRGRSWSVRNPSALIGNQTGGFVLAAPLPPLGTLFVASQLPVSLGPEGALAFVATSVTPGSRPAQTGRFATWDELHTVGLRGKKLFVGNKLFVTATSTGCARHLRDELQRLAKLPAAARPGAIHEVVAAMLDRKTIAAQQQDFDSRARPIRRLSNAVLLHLLVVAPTTIYLAGLSSSWLPLLIVLVVLTMANSVWFARTHRALHPLAEDERFTHTLTIALAPTSATRAVDALSRPLLEIFHPIAVGQVLLSEKEFREFARRVLLDLKYPALPACPSDDATARATEKFFRETQLAATENFLRRVKLDPATLIVRPVPNDSSCRAYCPRCGAQFTARDLRCADCGGRELQPLPQSNAS